LTCNKDMQYGNDARTSNMNMQHEHVARTYIRDM
jgi:hypothetical protein